jgi:elongation factor G
MPEAPHMKRPALERRRNIGIISHIDAGKTTTTERILYYSGLVHRIGEVDEGSATTDWMSQERERGISISAAAVTALWRDHEITIIDTPGHVDFTIEVERSLRVLDGAIAIFSAVEGVEPQSETVWRQADKFGVPRIVFINKLDRTGADFERTLEMIRERLGARPAIMQWPDGDGDRYAGQADVLSGEYLSWSEADGGREVHRAPLEGPLADKAAALREALAEAAADYDEGIAEAFLEGEEVETSRLKTALRRGVLAGEIVPVYCGAALRNRGIQPLLEGVIDYLPSPAEVPPAAGHLPGGPGGEEKAGEEGKAGEAIERPPDEDAPFSALVFKVQINEGRRLTYIRVYSGRARVGDEVLNTGQGKPERLARLFRMYSHKRNRIEEIGPGDIAAAAGMKWAATGDTLCDAKEPIVYESITAPPPVISSAIEPRSAGGAKKLDETLLKLEAEDPTFQVRRDTDSGQILISGMGELHLDVIAHRIAEEFGVEVRIGEPRVVYRETLLKEAEAEAVFDRELAGRPQYAKIRVRVAPSPGGGVVCESLITAGEEGREIPAELLGAALRALEASSGSGILAGYPMTDVRVQIAGAGYDIERGTEGAFGIAAGNAFVEACRKAGGQLLEPMMAVEVSVPEEFVGAVIADLNTRGGQIGGMAEQAGSLPGRIVRAAAPLSKMFGYATALRSATQGRATYTMTFSHYEKCEMAGV